MASIKRMASCLRTADPGSQVAVFDWQSEADQPLFQYGDAAAKDSETALDLFVKYKVSLIIASHLHEYAKFAERDFRIGVHAFNEVGDLIGDAF